MVLSTPVIYCHIRFREPLGLGFNACESDNELRGYSTQS